MITVTATATRGELGPLTQIALKWSEGIAERTSGQGATDADWEEISDCIAIDRFKRVGAYLKELNWQEYLRFLTQWAGGGAGGNRGLSHSFRSEIGDSGSILSRVMTPPSGGWATVCFRRPERECSHLE